MTQPLYRYSIAPMMQYTDRYFRSIMRRLCPNAWLYTEMQVASSIVFGNEHRFLDFDTPERPLILQLASSDPEQLAQAVERAEAYDYDGYNLNIGCPSEKAKKGGFGVCQMAQVELVLDLCEKVWSVSQKPLSIKHRIGIGASADYADLRAFVEPLYALGIRHFIVHARVALQGKVKPSQNRSIPPLRHTMVYRLKEDFPDAYIETNGGIKSAAEALEHLRHIDAVMFGRLAYQNPFILHRIDSLLHSHENKLDTQRTSGAEPDDEPFSDKEKSLFLQTILESLEIAKKLEASGGHSWAIIRHLLYFFAGCPGARNWRKAVASKNRETISTCAHAMIERL